MFAVIAAIVAAAIVVCQSIYWALPYTRLAPADGGRIVGRYRNVASNVAVALATYAFGIVFFGRYLVDVDLPSRWYAPILVLLLYDLGYYWLHRTLHWRPLMRIIHYVHHRTRHPTAIDSLYLHPLETVLGLVVQLGCVAAVGPLGLRAFIAVSLLHALINVLDHSNLSLPSPLAWLWNHWSQRHDAHHSRGGNYASITPIWDWLFGTTSR